MWPGSHWSLSGETRCVSGTAGWCLLLLLIDTSNKIPSVRGARWEKQQVVSVQVISGLRKSSRSVNWVLERKKQIRGKYGKEMTFLFVQSQHILKAAISQKPRGFEPEFHFQVTHSRGQCTVPHSSASHNKFFFIVMRSLMYLTTCFGQLGHL